MFIHGGYWQEMSLALSSYHARTLVKAGAVVVTVGYDLCPKGKKVFFLNKHLCLLLAAFVPVSVHLLSYVEMT